MANWYTVSGTSGGSGKPLDPWQTITAFNAGHAAVVGPTDTVWFSGEFDDAGIVVDKDGTSKDARFVIRGDYETTNAIIDGNPNTLIRCIGCVTDDYVEVRDFHVKNAIGTNGTGLLFENSIGCIARNVEASGCLWDGIKFRDSEDAEAVECNCHDNDVRGLGWATLSSPARLVTKGKISGCTLTANGRRGLTISGGTTASITDLSGVHATNVVITGNGEGVDFENCANCGISNSTISGNSLSGEGGETNHNISIHDSRGIHIVNSTINDHVEGSRGIYIEGLAVRSIAYIYGNTMTAAASQLIRVHGDNQNDIVEIVGNYLESTVDTNIVTLINSCNVVVAMMNNTCVGGSEVWRTGSSVDNGICKNNIFSGQRAAGYPYSENNSAQTRDLDNNVFWQAGGTPQIKINTVSQVGAAAILVYDANAIFEDPLLDSNHKPANPNLIGTGVYDSAILLGVDINGEPFPSIDLDIGCVQGTDAANHPFHPLNL